MVEYKQLSFMPPPVRLCETSEKVLAMFREAKVNRDGVTIGELRRLSLNYRGRIGELRRAGFNIVKVSAVKYELRSGEPQKARPRASRKPKALKMTRGCRAILSRLERGMASNDELSRISVGYNARLSELRRMGYEIKKTAGSVGGLWWYEFFACEKVAVAAEGGGECQ